MTLQISVSGQKFLNTAPVLNPP